MKNRLFLILAAILISHAATAQDTAKRIRINENFEIIPISQNAFIHVFWMNSPTFGRFGDNGLIYIDNNEAVIMDTPMNDSLSRQLLEWFSKTFPKATIKAVIVNHFHDDCLGGLRAFHEKGIASYANYMTNDLIKNDSTVKPQHTFTNELKLRIGKTDIVNRYLGPGHSPDNIVTWVPSEKILFGGCMIKSLDAGRGNLSDATLQKWSATVSKVKKEFPNATIIIPGHGDHGGIPLLDYTIKMFEGDAK